MSIVLVFSFIGFVLGLAFACVTNNKTTELQQLRKNNRHLSERVNELYREKEKVIRELEHDNRSLRNELSKPKA